MRIIFVGMHNKPGKSPLDNSTMTGKIIDKIIDMNIEAIEQIAPEIVIIEK